MKACVCALLVAAVLRAQPGAPPVAQAVPLPPKVEGTVVSSTNGEPVRKATVLLRARDSKATSYATESDSNGHFVIENVEPGEYSISADRQGFWYQTPGAAGAPPPRIKVEKEQQMTGVLVRLTPLCVITGKVLDQEGDPVRDATVESMHYVYQAGKKELQPATQVSSNDSGEYRLFGMRAGTFYVRATQQMRFVSMDPGRRSSHRFAPTYFPGATDVDGAAAVELTPGATVAGIDIRLRSEVMYSIRVKMPQAMNNFNLWIESRSGERRRGGFNQMYDGQEFVFPDLLPGPYVVRAMSEQDGKRVTARVPVEVASGDVEVNELPFAPLADVIGSVRLEGTATLGTGGVILQGDENQLHAEIKPDGTFVFHEVVPDIYRVVFRTNHGYVKSVSLDGKELPDLRVDLRETAGKLTVVIGSDTGEVEGSIVKANGDPAVRARVTLIASGKNDGRTELFRFAFSDDKGKFHFLNVAPGEYKIFAWEDVPVGAPQDPAFRKPYEKQAAAIKMDSNGHATADLTAIKIAK